MTNPTSRAIVKGAWAALGAVAIASSLLILAGCLIVINRGLEPTRFLQYTTLTVMVFQLVGATTAGYVASVQHPGRWILSAAFAAVAFQLFTNLVYWLIFAMTTRVPAPPLLPQLMSTLMSVGISAALGVVAAWVPIFWRRRKMRALA